jgi:ATP-dependent protease HslVU (ClpYQ) peptidase subunit
MTVIVGLIGDNGEIVVGGDSSGISDTEMDIRNDPKVFTKSGFVFGFAGSFRVCQLVRFGFAVPTILDQYDPYEYMVMVFVKELFSFLKNNEIDIKEEDFSCVVAFKRNLFVVSADMQVADQKDGYCAIGNGSQSAKGALYALKKAGCFSSKNAVVVALKASERYNTDVRGPFIIETVPVNTKTKF